MLRTEIAEKDTWDLSLIFPSETAWEEAFTKTESDLKQIPAMAEKMQASAQGLFETVRDIIHVREDINRIANYAHLRLSEDTGNSTAQRLFGKAQNLAAAYGEATAFFDSTLLQIPADTFETFLKEHEGLREYEITLREIMRERPHTLSTTEETLLASFDKERETAANTYNTLVSADLKFGNITDEDGNQTELTSTNYALFMRSQKASVREEAFRTLYRTYEQFGNTFASLYAGEIEAEMVCAKVRHFDSALEHSLFADHMTPQIYQNIIDGISERLDVLFRYYRLKKRVLGTETLAIHDIYQPLIASFHKKYTYEEAVEEVLAALSVLGEDYVRILREGYAKRWVDVYPNQGKVGGAFSSGCATTEPYILMNFIGMDEDVETLAHESGHSMHSYFTRKNNPLQYADYRILVAEVPSTVNELLLSYYRLEHAQSKDETLSILNSLMELFKSTIYRQAMFAEFEAKTHEFAEQGEVLTKELLCKTYYEINEKYFGGEIVLDEEIACEWMRIPHFYYHFYVYKYAVGLSAAAHIVKRIRSGEAGAVEDYMHFLKLGETKNPIESLKIAGVDITKTDVFHSAADLFDDIITRFEEAYNS